MSRRRSRRRALVLAALASAAFGACGPFDASQSRVLLHPNGDVLAAGPDVSVADSVPGDAMTAGGTVTFDGVVGGSYVGAGGEQDVRGRIDGSARAAGGTVRLGASVGRNATLAGGSVQVERDADIGRNVYLAGGTVRVEGSVGGDLYVGAGEVVLDGTVGGDVRVEAERLSLGPQARLSGDLRYRTADGLVEIDPQARILGDAQALAPREDGGPGRAIVFTLLRLLAFLLTGTVVVALFPSVTRSLAAGMAARVGASLGFGVLGLLVVPLGALIAAVTLVGLPLAAITAGLLVIVLYLAPVVPALWVGHALLGSGPEAAPEKPEELKRFLVGGPVVALPMFIPWVGFPIRLVAVALGLGALALTLFRSEPPSPTRESPAGR